MNNAARIAIVLVGILVPAAFVLFVISIARRGREFKKFDGLFSAIAQLHEELHRAFAADKARSPSKH
jgi:hypothetical protein